MITFSEEPGRVHQANEKASTTKDDDIIKSIKSKFKHGQADPYSYFLVQNGVLTLDLGLMVKYRIDKIELITAKEKGIQKPKPEPETNDPKPPNSGQLRSLLPTTKKKKHRYQLRKRQKRN